MPFVFVACREGQKGHARALASLLGARGIDACSGLEQAPAHLRDSAYQAAVDRCVVGAALWAEGDDVDPAYVDLLLYAQRSGRLIAIPIGEARLPGVLGENRAARVWRERDEQSQAALVEAIANAVEQYGDQGFEDGPAQARLETQRFLRLQKRPDANALARFLRDFPDGIFEPVVRDQLDGQTRPQYGSPDASLLDKASQLLAVRKTPEARSEDEERAGDVWRMDNSWISRLQAGAGSVLQQKHLLMIGAIVALALVGSVATAWLIASTGRAHAPSSQIAVAPQSAVAVEPAPNRAPPLPTREPEIRAPPDAPVSDGAIASPRSLPEQALVQVPPVIVASQSAEPAPAPQTSASSDTAQAERAAIESARRQDTLRGYDAYLSAYPVGGFSAEARASRQRLLDGPPAYDLSHLEASARNAVERARSSEAAGRAAAQRNNETLFLPNTTAGAGAYRGTRAQGMAEGAGAVSWANGDVYSGLWSRSRPNGFGVLRLSSGARYEGEFANGAPTGRGVFWNEEGRRLVGDRLFAALVRARVQ